MKCRYCNADIPDDAVFCSACGKRLDDKMECPVCGKFTHAGAFCVYCGAPLGAEDDNSGVTLSGYTAEPLPDISVVTDETSVDALTEEATVRDLSWKKKLSTVSLVLGLLSVLVSFVFMFFVGMTYKISGYGTTVSGGEGIHWYDFFGSAYSDIQAYEATSSYSREVAGAARAMSGLCTFVSVLFMVMTAVSAIVVAVKFYRMRRGKNVRALRTYIVLTYFFYLTYALSFRCILGYRVTGLGLDAGIVLNGATLAGTITGGLLVGASIVGFFLSGDTDLAKIKGDRRRMVSFLKPLVFSAVLILLAGLASGAIFGFSEDVLGEKYIIKMSPLSYRVYYGESDMYSYISTWDTACQYWQVLIIVICTLATSTMLSRYAEDRPRVPRKGKNGYYAFLGKRAYGVTDEGKLVDMVNRMNDRTYAVLLLIVSAFLLFFGTRLLSDVSYVLEFDGIHRTYGAAVTAVVFGALMCVAEIALGRMEKRHEVMTPVSSPVNASRTHSFGDAEVPSDDTEDKEKVNFLPSGGKDTSMRVRFHEIPDRLLYHLPEGDVRLEERLERYVSYGTRAIDIYDACCGALGWDINKKACFGNMKPLFAPTATPERFSVWFVNHSDVVHGEEEFGENVKQNFVRDKEIVEVDKNGKDIPDHDTYRLTFVLSKKKYVYFGVFKRSFEYLDEETEELTRVFARLPEYDSYPLK